ncbi:hypothetical protein OAT84_03895 [Gammaproteobacteria bacterium]|nr:hypothetical protein [Gammaproteobacteria bacterium]
MRDKKNAKQSIDRAIYDSATEGAPKVDRSLTAAAIESNYGDVNSILRDSKRADDTEFKADQYVETHAKGNQPPAGSGMSKTGSSQPAKRRTKMKQKQGPAESKAMQGVTRATDENIRMDLSTSSVNSENNYSMNKGKGDPYKDKEDLAPARPIGPKPKI